MRDHFQGGSARLRLEPRPNRRRRRMHIRQPHCAQPQTTCSKRHEKHRDRVSKQRRSCQSSPRAAQSTMATPSPKDWRPHETVLGSAHVERSHVQTVQQSTAARSRWAHSSQLGSGAESGAHSTPTGAIVEPWCLSAAATSRMPGSRLSIASALSQKILILRYVYS